VLSVLLVVAQSHLCKNYMRPSTFPGQWSSQSRTRAEAPRAHTSAQREIVRLTQVYDALKQELAACQRILEGKLTELSEARVPTQRDSVMRFMVPGMTDVCIMRDGVARMAAYTHTR